MPGRRIILMYISEVSGHHSATLAIEKAIKMLEPNAEIMNINAFNYTNPISEKIVNRIYLGIIKRTPKIWDYLYDNPSVVKRVDKIKASIHRFNSPKFKKLFDKFQPDVVACAQAFPCGMVADYKKTYNSNIPLVAVLTDYVPHAYWVYDSIDYYVVPSEEVELRLHRKGVAQAKIKNFGIPFDPEFNTGISKDEVMKKLGFNLGLPTILIMGGGQGLGPIKTIVRSLDKSGIEFQEVIVTGINKKLYRYLKRRIRKYRKKISLFGYVDNINELMTASDMIITKPGGITTAEALSKQLPMIIVKPIPGQEVNNTAYLAKHLAAVKIDKPKDVKSAVEDLLLNPGKLERMRQSIAHISKPHASVDTAKLLLDLAAKPHV